LDKLTTSPVGLHTFPPRMRLTPHLSDAALAAFFPHERRGESAPAASLTPPKPHSNPARRQ
jgi:hypothetical protein